MALPAQPSCRDEFEIAIICALRIERDAVEALLDEEYETDSFSYGKSAADKNAYTTGRIGDQNVVLAYMPSMGMITATAVAANMGASFQGIKCALVVGVCGGIPITADGTEILLGDVIISTSVIQTDFGRQLPDRLVRKKEEEDTLGRANPEIRAFAGRLSGYLVRTRLEEKTAAYSAQVCAKPGFSQSVYPGPEHDKLYPADHRHKHRQKTGVQANKIHEPCICDNCQSQDDEACQLALQSSCEDLGCADSLSVERTRIQKAMGVGTDGRVLNDAEVHEAQAPAIHFGRMACSNQVMKSGRHRDQIAQEEKVIGFEMESAGTGHVVPTIVIKSVCDYADSHKNKRWQDYAAVTAAACTKAVLEEWRNVDRPQTHRLERGDQG
ncbi:hypothetical protein LTR84_000481 [Exophiala bonariae]|uniref:Nucleoside phosphorylase domain-containing protein n=1 Tax=Exophiala bonariae TaxID=1690606 RepID=A0AAV9NR14_9EURO|nr:hypothetical protein LTR84_000481 [Exophiala bonariae]